MRVIGTFPVTLIFFFSFYFSMPNLITNLAATTELEAVNKMLRVIGEAPITDLLAGQELTDVAMATAELRDATRAVQALPWQFNTRFQFPVMPSATMFWTDPDESAGNINIFVPPPQLGSFTPSSVQGLDLAIMPSAVWNPGTLVFVDRTFNRDGLVAADYPILYIDGTFIYDFEKLPETARQYITVLAGRRFIQAAVGAQELAGFQRQDELIALRALKRDQGDEDEYNMLYHPDVYRVLGGRPMGGGYFVDSRRGR